MKSKWLIASGLILVELLLCAGIIAAAWTGMTRFSTMRIRLGEFVRETVKATADEEQRLTVGGPATVEVNREGNLPAIGDVTIVAGSDGEVVVSAHKTAWGVDPPSAQTALEALKVVVDQRGDTISVWVDRPEEVLAFGRSQPDTVDFTISVPAETTVMAASDLGDLSLSGTRGGVDLDTDFGEVSVQGVTADGLEVHSDFGAMTLETIQAHNVTAGSNAGAIILRNVDAAGAVDLNTDFGQVTFEGGSAESLDAQTNSGDVKIAAVTVQQTATVRSDFGSMTLTDVSAASYDVDGNSGAIVIDGAAGPVKAHTDFGDITVTGAEAADIDLSTNSGAIEFAGSLGDGPHAVTTSFGTVRMSLPEESQLDLDLKTSMGRIQSALPITLRGEQENNHWTGTANGGGGSLTVETGSGDITIEVLK